MGGYQQLVRGEAMRGRFRNSFEKPEPFKPGKPTKVEFALPDVHHTFQTGHRIMVQVQSTWFPLVDRNPQKFVDIYLADEVRLSEGDAARLPLERPRDEHEVVRVEEVGAFQPRDGPSPSGTDNRKCDSRNHPQMLARKPRARKDSVVTFDPRLSRPNVPNWRSRSRLGSSRCESPCDSRRD